MRNHVVACLVTIPSKSDFGTGRVLATRLSQVVVANSVKCSPPTPRSRFDCVRKTRPERTSRQAHSRCCLTPKRSAGDLAAKLCLGHVIPCEACILVLSDKRETLLRQAREHGEEGLGAR